MSYPTAEEIRGGQLKSLNELLAQIVPANPFYTRKILEADAPRQFGSLEEFAARFPFTAKSELVEDQERHPIYGRNLTFPPEAYSRMHQTSGTSGKPMRWLDTPATWSGMVDTWVDVFKAAGAKSTDVGYFAFSFGPFLGFWLAFEAGNRIGMLCIPGGSLSTLGRLQAILETKATILCCTPSYAVHLAEKAAEERIDLRKSRVRLIMVAGEPGGSLPATRALIERLWPGAKVSDHHGMTETGPVTYECPARPCRLHVASSAYFAEIIAPGTNEAVAIGERGELVLTTLKRVGSPLLRYRTGDLVAAAKHHLTNGACECGRHDLALEGGILGRTDDMVVIRGVNVYPTAIEQIVRQFGSIAEYQVHITRRGAMAEMHLVIEPGRDVKNVATLVADVEKQLQTTFNLRIPVTAAAPNTLPRAELKAKRWLKS